MQYYGDGVTDERRAKNDKAQMVQMARIKLSIVRRYTRDSTLRFWQYSLLPLLGSVAVVFLFNIYSRPDWPSVCYNTISSVFHVLPAALLVRRLDDLPPGRFELRVSWQALRFSVGWFAAAVILVVWDGPKQLLAVALLVAAIVGFFTTVPAREFADRSLRCRSAVSLALLGMTAYFTGALTNTLWAMQGLNYISPVPFLIGLCDIEVTAIPIDKPEGIVILIYSDMWELLFAQQCSGFTFVFLFLSLFSTLSLQGAGTWRHTGILATRICSIVVMLLVANLARFADLFCYGDSIIRRLGRTVEASDLITSYHQAGAYYFAEASLAVFVLAACVLFDRNDQNGESAIGKEAAGAVEQAE